MSKFHTINGSSNPEVFCAKLMEVSDEIEHIACVVTWKNGKTTTANTAMKTGEIVWMRFVFDDEFHPDKLECP